MRKRCRIRIPNGILTAALTVGLTAAVGSAAAGQSGAARAEAFADRHGLVAGAEVIRDWTLGTREWHVWVCDLARGGSGSALRHPSEYARLYNEQITPYFEWLSQGNYRPVFVGKRILNAPGVNEGPQQRERCQEQAVREETARGHPSLIIDNSGYGGGEASPDVTWGSRYGWQWPLRITGGTAWVGGNSGLGVVVHEIGHILSLPHSYSGDRTRTTDGWRSIVDEYDNPMDIMSGNSRGLEAGTPAINRYAAGWIAPEEVAVHDDDYAEYALRPTGEGGIQMLVIPAYEGAGVFYTLGVRTRSKYEQGLPVEGVEVYLVDQQGLIYEDGWVQCAGDGPIGEWCWGLGRRTQQYPGPDRNWGPSSTRHIHTPYSERFELDDWWLRVRQRVGDTYVVRVWDRNIPESDIDWGCAVVHNGAFCDDDGGVHETGIETIAEAGITNGCRPDYFCPERTIRRSQMAAFLYRAVRHADPAILSYGVWRKTMNDVEEDAWYRPYAAWAASWGAMTVSDGRFNPDGVVSRADMAVMLTETFDNLQVPEETHDLFADMENEPDEAVRAAETLYRMGITAGCSVSPLRYCPSQPVTRGQMASFFARVLTRY